VVSSNKPLPSVSNPSPAKTQPIYNSPADRNSSSRASSSQNSPKLYSYQPTQQGHQSHHLQTVTSPLDAPQPLRHSTPSLGIFQCFLRDHKRAIPTPPLTETHPTKCQNTLSTSTQNSTPHLASAIPSLSAHDRITHPSPIHCTSPSRPLPRRGKTKSGSREKRGY